MGTTRNVYWKIKGCYNEEIRVEKEELLLMKINANGTITVTREEALYPKFIKEVLNLMVRAEYNDGEIIHSRWSTLYNAYDMMYDCDVRKSFKAYRYDVNMVNMLEYLARRGELTSLLMVACKIYPKEFEIHRYLNVDGCE